MCILTGICFICWMYYKVSAEQKQRNPKQSYIPFNPMGIGERNIYTALGSGGAGC